MIKKFLIFVLSIIVVFSMVACKNEKQLEPEYHVVEHTEPALTYEIETYMVDSWREELDGGVREYFVTLLTYSEDCACEISANDVKILNANHEYVGLLEEIEGSEITVINSPTVIESTNAYIKIKTNKLIDTKKLFVRVDGKIIESGEKKAVLTSISPLTTPNSDAVSNQLVEEHGILRLHNQSNSLYYYDFSKNEIFVEDNRHIVKIYLEQYKEDGLDVFAIDAVGEGAYCFAEIKNDEMEFVELNEEIALTTRVESDYVFVEFSTVDGTNIEEKMDLIPSYLSCGSDKVVNFAMK